eukprot:CAMPEP_0194258818 /NCGR_PEP_ID=MMETSP0158-20130606/42121_1 /TAXON_ID=33649 /ORGANISM="Thalassionema nitzschioides, Strain L26-B" /LENGTH=268 /DNA_ID=CAMNT_0038998357 /DNA_START=1 /DNA_END=803 /DNA_ORIENTATION=-
MLFQRPFVNDFSKTPDHVWAPYSKFGTNTKAVTHGKPMAQDYNFGDKWYSKPKEVNLTHVVGKTSPVHSLSVTDAARLYPAGPPYIVTARDMYRIVVKWCDFLPKIFDVHPVFMSEMYGYCMAAAHLQLPHQLAKGFMISNIDMTRGEGWNFITNTNGPQVCDDDNFQTSIDTEDLPFVLHFCQRYSIGEFFISKYKVPTDLLSCENPLLQLPPKNIASTAHHSHYGDNSIKEWSSSNIKKYRNAFLVCRIMTALNRAATFWKDNHCT